MIFAVGAGYGATVSSINGTLLDLQTRAYVPELVENCFILPRANQNDLLYLGTEEVY